MAKLTRFGSAASAFALTAALAGCAAPGAKTSVAKASQNVGTALRAQAALATGDLASAVSFAEQAAAKTPQSAEVRALLGNAYFASGRFASAEAAFRDSLTLDSVQPHVILKLALVQIAQGKNAEAVALLASAQGIVDPADHGLALALAGQPNEAIQVLEPAARAIGADARVRQNLALAYGIAGDWTAARTIAEQDLPGSLVDARIQQWMALAKPARASDQVATLVGVVPAAADPGQPVHLALNPSPAATRLAQAAPVAAPAPVAAEVAAPVQPQVAAVELPPLPLAPTAPIEAVASDIQAPAPIVAAATVEAPAPIVAAAPAPAFAPTPAPRKVLARVKARAAATARAAAAPALGRSNSVVQLGAYKTPERVTLAWQELTARHPELKGYTPLRARFDGPQGTVWRLSIKGFRSQSAAQASCSQFRSHGGSCFVRTVAGDAPVQFASR